MLKEHWPAFIQKTRVETLLFINCSVAGQSSLLNVWLS